MRGCWSVARYATSQAKLRDDEVALTEAIVRLASKYGRYGYRRIGSCLWRRAGT